MYIKFITAPCKVVVEKDETSTVSINPQTQSQDPNPHTDDQNDLRLYLKMNKKQ